MVVLNIILFINLERFLLMTKNQIRTFDWANFHSHISLFTTTEQSFIIFVSAKFTQFGVKLLQGFESNSGPTIWFYSRWKIYNAKANSL